LLVQVIQVLLKAIWGLWRGRAPPSAFFQLVSILQDGGRQQTYLTKAVSMSAGRLSAAVACLHGLFPQMHARLKIEQPFPI